MNSWMKIIGTCFLLGALMVTGCRASVEVGDDDKKSSLEQMEPTAASLA